MINSWSQSTFFMTFILDLAGILIKYITNALDITLWWIFSLQIWRNESQGRDMEIFYCRIIIERARRDCRSIHFWLCSGQSDFYHFPFNVQPLPWWPELSLLIAPNLLGRYSLLNVLQIWSNKIEWTPFPISYLID